MFKIFKINKNSELSKGLLIFYLIAFMVILQILQLSFYFNAIFKLYKRLSCHFYPFLRKLTQVMIWLY